MARLSILLIAVMLSCGCCHRDQKAKTTQKVREKYIYGGNSTTCMLVSEDGGRCDISEVDFPRIRIGSSYNGEWEGALTAEAIDSGSTAPHKIPDPPEHFIR